MNLVEQHEFVIVYSIGLIVRIEICKFFVHLLGGFIARCFASRECKLELCCLFEATFVALQLVVALC